MLYIFRWLKGFVKIKVCGKFPERFINIVTRSGFSIWDTVRDGELLYACMYLKDYKKIRPFARKSRVLLRIIKKQGFPFFIRKYKLRVGVLCGVCLFALIVYFMSCFVWTINIVGLETISQAKLLSALKDNGLYIGMYKNNVSFKMIERNTMLDIDEIGWMSVNVTNSHANVEIKEKALSPEVPDYKKPANVKAERDGLILSINTTEGVSYFEKGSAVVKDQLVVSAIVEDQLGGLRFVRANAQIIAQTKRKHVFSVPKICEVPTFSDKKSRYKFSVFKAEIPISTSFADTDNSLVTYKTESLNLFETVLPVSLESQSLYEIKRCNVSFSEKEAHNALQKQSLVYQAFELSECLVKDKKYRYYETDTKYCLDAEFICEEDIAYQQEINVDNADLTQITPTEKDDKSSD